MTLDLNAIFWYNEEKRFVFIMSKENTREQIPTSEAQNASRGKENRVEETEMDAALQIFHEKYAHVLRDRELGNIKTKIEGEEVLKRRFLEELIESKSVDINALDEAEEILEVAGDDIDFKAIEGYEDMVKEKLRAMLIYELNNGYLGIYHAVGILEKKRQKGGIAEGIEIDGYEDIIKEQFINELKKGDIRIALMIKKEIGKKIDFTTIKGYEDAVKIRYGDEFMKYMKTGDTRVLKRCIRIKKELGEGMDFKKFVLEEGGYY